jgi:AcrR family transcriptional regulator
MSALRNQKHVKSSSPQPNGNFKFSRTRRSAWIKAAEEVLKDRTSQSIRVSVLADRVGVSRPSFYYHFESRDELVEELIYHRHVKELSLVAKCFSQYQNLFSSVMNLVLARLTDGKTSEDMKRKIVDLTADNEQATSLIKRLDEELVRIVSV